MYATFSSPRRGYLCHDMRATLRGKQSLTELPAGCAIESSSNRTKIDLIFPAQFIAHRQRKRMILRLSFYLTQQFKCIFRRSWGG